MGYQLHWVGDRGGLREVIVAGPDRKLDWIIDKISQLRAESRIVVAALNLEDAS